MEFDFSAYQNIIFNSYTLILLITIVILGVVMGFRNMIVVYRDYDDLGISFLLTLSPVILFYVLQITNNNIAFFIFILIIEIILIAWLFYRTFNDNSKNILFALLSFITKTTLSVLFIINLLQLVSPSGKSSRQRASARKIAFAILLVISPVVFSLVKNKEGIFNPSRTLSRRGISF